jgi:predicted DNA-binding mobile mystery protein A
MDFQDLKLKQVERALEPLMMLADAERPSQGWLRTIRQAMGMTTRQFARRLHLSQPSVVDSEMLEAKKRISLAQLEKMANALNCRLVYALIPRAPLSSIVDKQAELVATREVTPIAHTMALEDQGATPKFNAALIATTKRKLLDGKWSKLWD